jgi:hypothetical protein
LTRAPNNCNRCDCCALQAAPRPRANDICNRLGRGETVISPFVVGALMVDYGLQGVIWLMIGLSMVHRSSPSISGASSRRGGRWKGSIRDRKRSRQKSAVTREMEQDWAISDAHAVNNLACVIACFFREQA